MRWSWVFESPNILGAVVVVASASLLCATILCRRYRIQALLALPGLLLWIPLVASQSRGALAAGLAAFAFVGIIRWRVPRDWVACALCGLALIGCFMLWPGSRARVAAMGTSEQGTITRFELWRTASILVADHSLSGVGDRGFLAASATIRKLPAYEGREVHPGFSGAIGDVFDVPAKHGLPALAALVLAVGFLGTTSAHLTFRGDPLAAAVVAGTTALVTAGVFSCVWFFDPWASRFFALFLLSSALLLVWRRTALPWRSGLVVAGALSTSLCIGIALAGSAWSACERPGVAFVDRRVDATSYQLTAAPRGRAPCGAVVVILPNDSRELEAALHVLRPLAGSGWRVTATTGPVPVDGVQVLVGFDRSRHGAQLAMARDRDLIAVLADPLPASVRSLAEMGTSAPAVVLVYGEPNRERLRQRGRSLLSELAGRHAVVTERCGPMWINRLPAAWPAVEEALLPMLDR